jgi:hypothetical protein
MVGVGFKDVIKKNEFKFASNGIGHGGYLLANNSCLYSHHSKSNNMIMKGITFATG